MTDWRSIRCEDVDWYICGNKISRRATHALRRLSYRPERESEWQYHYWIDLTLGELADMGVRAWRRSAHGGIGPVAEQIIMATIDRAAEGGNVCKTIAADAYIPKCERDRPVSDGGGK